ncbi:alternate-type signal peptide domain-containing protein [Arthrobacter sp. NPDC055585]
MAKGALATGVGVALLLGGGGTLAVWNDTANAQAGTIAAGTLDLKEPAKGTWTSNISGTVVDITTYKIVPGETLTYTQQLDVTLVGDQMKATLGIDGVPASTFANGDVRVEGPKFTDAGGVVLKDGVLTPDNAKKGKVTASATFAFDAANQSSVNATANLANIVYKLSQMDPNKRS